MNLESASFTLQNLLLPAVYSVVATAQPPAQEEGLQLMLECSPQVTGSAQVLMHGWQHS